MRTYTDPLERIRSRCQDWGVWKRDRAWHRGWNVSVSDFDQVLGTQKRNDTHSDPVVAEVASMRREEWRIETTESAYRGLTRRLRRVIFARFVISPDARETSNTRLARDMGIDRHVFGERIETALELMDASIASQRQTRMRDVA